MENEYSKVPADFPYSVKGSSISGYQPKVALVTYEGKAYQTGNTPPERYEQWMMCEGFLTYLVSRCQSKMSSDISNEEIRSEYALLITKGREIVTNEQLRWVIQRAAAMLGRPLPDIQDKPWMPKTVEVDDAVIKAFIQQMEEAPRTKSSLKAYIERRLKLPRD